MNYETILIDLLINGKHIKKTDIMVYEEAPDDPTNVLIEIHLDEKVISKKSDNLFSALQEIRRDLEQDNILVLCNGAAKNVYPSPMQLSMGIGRKAYALQLSCYAKLKDMVDIFEKNPALDFVCVDEQKRFYEDWIKSIRKEVKV